MFLGSCSTSGIDEPVTPPHGDPERVTITVRTPETRTTLDADFNVCWQADDQVVINGNIYTVIPDAADPTMATIPDVVKADDYLAVYTHPENVVFGGNDEVSFYVDYFQPYYEGSFGRYKNPMVAYSTTTDIAFKNIFGIIRIPIMGSEYVRSVSLFDNQEQGMAGWVDFNKQDIIDGSYALQPSEYGFVSTDVRITLDANEPAYLYFAVPARTYADGLTVVMEDNNGRTAVQTTRNAITVGRSQIVDMAPFAFTEAAPLSISVNATTIDSIDYTVSGEPYAPVTSFVVGKTTWDYHKSAWNITDDDELARQFMNCGWLYGVEWLAVDGQYNIVATSARNAEYGSVSIEADMDYYIISGYTHSYWEASSVVYTTTRTPSADGTEVPEVSFSTAVPDEKPYAKALFTVYTKNAANIRYCFNTPQQYAERSATMSDAEIVSTFGYDWVESQVSEANNDNGYIYSEHYLKSNTTYVILVTATTAGGAAVTGRCDYTTACYIDPELQWTTISTTSTMENLTAILSPWMSYAGWYVAENLTVQKLQGKEFYRIVDPFRASVFTDDSSFTNTFSYTDDRGYIIIDATDPENVMIEWRESLVGIKYSEYLVVSVCAYDETAGHVVEATETLIHIEFPYGVFPAVEDTNDGLYNYYGAKNGGIVLKINLSPDKGVSTESFKHNGTYGW